MEKIYVITLILVLGFLPAAHAQVNLQFEENGMGTTEGWEYTCFEPVLVEEGANGSSDWSVQVESGNAQGCVYSYVYFTFDGDSIPGGLVVDYDDFGLLNVGVNAKSLGGLATLSSGKIDSNGNPVLFFSDTTSSTSWKFLQTGFSNDIQPGEMPAVFLSAGLTAGPAPSEFALFDDVEFAALTSDEEPGLQDIQLYPNPAKERVYLHLPKGLASFEIVVYNILGKPVDCAISADHENAIIDVSDLLEGLYFVQLFDGKRPIYTEGLVVY